MLLIYVDLRRKTKRANLEQIYLFISISLKISISPNLSMSLVLNDACLWFMINEATIKSSLERFQFINQRFNDHEANDSVTYSLCILPLKHV